MPALSYPISYMTSLNTKASNIIFDITPQCMMSYPKSCNVICDIIHTSPMMSYTISKIIYDVKHAIIIELCFDHDILQMHWHVLSLQLVWCITKRRAQSTVCCLYQEKEQINHYLWKKETIVSRTSLESMCWMSCIPFRIWPLSDCLTSPNQPDSWNPDIQA